MYDTSRAAAILAATAAAAAPIVAAAIAKAAQPPANALAELVGATPAMADLRRSVERAAAAPFPVLIDGAHGFPYPILDWWFLAPHVRVGGQVLLDDAYLPAVGAIVDFAKANPAWRLEAAVSFRTARLRKLSDEVPPFDADARASHGRMRFAYLPPAQRAAASVRQRLFSTPAGLWLVERLRPPRPNQD